jgi:KaiC/GvpD/RAD55 family RecA-like ATPase
MSQVKRLPDELAEFLQLSGPQTLLVRGAPGSGKTSLCLEMLHEFVGKKMFVTCRVPTAKLQQDFHWLVGPDPIDWRILDLTTRPSSIEEAARVLLNANLLRTSTDDDAAAMRALWLPGAIQEAWGDTNPNEPTLIVVDPWNAFIDQYVESGRRLGTEVPVARELELTLLSLIGRTRIHLVFVMEGEEPTQLDYLVDGVLVTERRTSNSHLERWLTLAKLRGVPVNRPLYPFTLDGGKFRCISPMPSPLGLSPTGPERDPEPGALDLWPGNVDFARFFGRLTRGSLTLLELGPEVPREVPRVFVLPIMAEVLARQGRVVLVPPPTLSPEDSYTDLARIVPAAELASHFRILGVFPTPELTRQFESVFVPPSRISWTKDGITVPVPEDPAFRVGAKDSPGMNLLVAYFSGLEGLAQSAGVALTREAIPGAAHVAFGGSPVHMIAIGRAGDPYFSAVLALAALHLRVESHQGRVLLHGYRPFTEEFAVTQSTADAPYRLLRIN